MIKNDIRAISEHQYQQDDAIMVSIVVATYNHEKYITEALDSFLMQKTDFRVEILVNDDASTDTTAQIVKKYEEKFPHLFVTFYQTVNQYSQGKKPWFNVLFPAARGKYIALCESDDYWTDSYKLQKQVDFLNANINYGICFHNVVELNTFDISLNRIIPNVANDLDFKIEDYILNNKTATCSMVFKKEFMGTMPKWLNFLPFGDLAVILLVMNNSNKIGRVFSDVMGVYRIHHGGVHGNFHKSREGLIKAYLQHIEFTKIIYSKFLNEKKYKKIVLLKYLNTYEILSHLYKGFDKTNFIKVKFIGYYYNLLIKNIFKS